MTVRGVRLMRGLAAAVSATSVAAFSHVIAGGPSPDAAIVFLSLALSGLVCTALTGRELSLWRLCTAVVLSQGLFHGLFTLDPSSHAMATTAQPSGHAGHSTQPMLEHVVTAGAMDHSAPTMGLAHAIAAALTIAVLRHGEVTTVRLIQALRLKLVPFLRLFQPLAVAPGAPFDPTNWPVRPLRNLGVLLLVMRYRGPPTLPVVS